MNNKFYNNIYIKSFLLVKNNLVLFLPFFMYLLISGFILMPMSTLANKSLLYFFLIMVAFLAVFLSGWLSMFKKCVETQVIDNEPQEKRTSKSLLLFQEFFPGVGKYFGKMLIGVALYFILIKLFMTVLELGLIKLFGGFDSFNAQDFLNTMKSHTEASAFWKSISSSDQLKLMKIAGLEIIISFLYIYLTMFWTQLIIMADITPLQALAKSVKTVLKAPFTTFIMLISCFSSIFIVLYIGAILPVNPILQLLLLILYVYVIVFSLMLTFVYLEKYQTKEEKDANITQI